MDRTFSEPQDIKLEFARRKKKHSLDMLLAWTGAAVVMSTGAIPAFAEPLGSAAIAAQVKKGWSDWKAAMQDSGWAGLQPRIDDCYKQVAAKPSQSRAVYCATLDHLSLLDTQSFPANLRPPYFATDAVFARLDKAVAETAPRADRQLFESRLLSNMQETIHQIGEGDRAKKGRRK